ncbi:MAG TPA: tripartite tricarboxylate transporter substrate-binding protein [Acidimicrobiia bacterium]|jgi:putative tricarboxylic transport membrane protein
MQIATQRIEIVAGTPPGGGQDRAARALAAAIESSSATTATVSNVVGRGGGAAWELLGSRIGDPTVASISSPTLLSNHLHDPDEPGEADLTHLAMLCAEPLVFAVAADSAVASASDLLDALGRRSVRVVVATALGNINHMAVADVAAHVDVPIEALPVSAYSSAKEAVASLGVDSDLAVVSAASALGAIALGQVRAVALASPGRLTGELSHVPVWTELGVDAAHSTWRGVVAPPGLAPVDRRELELLVERAVAAPPWQDAVVRYAWVPMFLLGSDAETFIAAETESMRSSLVRLGMLDG